MAVENNAHPVTFWPDGQFVAAGLYSNEVVDWDVATGKLQWSLSWHKALDYRIDLAPDGKSIASACGDGIAKFAPTSPLMLSDS